MAEERARVVEWPAAVEADEGPPIRRRGRPYAITAEVRERLLRALEEGRPVAAACGLAGISKPTVYAHMRRFADFFDEVQRARGSGLAELDRTVWEMVRAEAAAGSAKGLVAYYRLRLAMYERETEEERREGLSHEVTEEVLDFIVAAVVGRIERRGGAEAAGAAAGERDDRQLPAHPADGGADGAAAGG